jgi:hypothetical protein
MMVYSVGARTAMREPLEALGMEDAIVLLEFAIDRATAFPFPESTVYLPTDNVDHWEVWFRDKHVPPPLDAIRAFVLYLHQLIDAVGGRPMRASPTGVQSTSNSSGSSSAKESNIQPRTPEDHRASTCCVLF